MTLRNYFAHFKVGKAGLRRNAPNARQRKVLKAGLKKVAWRTHARSQVVVDLAKSIQRAPTGVGTTPCLVANSSMFWTNQRPLVGR